MMKKKKKEAKEQNGEEIRGLGGELGGGSSDEDGKYRTVSMKI